MIYKFKSKADGDLIMLEPSGRRVLEIIGKDAGPKGIITAQQIPGAIQALDRAIAHEEAIHKPAGSEGAEMPEGHEPTVSITLRQRAKPFLDMLRRCEAAQADVVWGV
ncbi:MAG: DUF1840 domain-containing protein [Ramlibacter sp.]|nr:DUF1840 domain-containing protein [Ramlibacter sp.]